jgi:hypothetical protein
LLYGIPAPSCEIPRKREPADPLAYAVALWHLSPPPTTEYPGFGPHGLAVRTAPSHGAIPGSIPGGVTSFCQRLRPFGWAVARSVWSRSSSFSALPPASIHSAPSARRHPYRPLPGSRRPHCPIATRSSMRSALGRARGRLSSPVSSPSAIASSVPRATRRWPKSARGDRVELRPQRPRVDCRGSVCRLDFLEPPDPAALAVLGKENAAPGGLVQTDLGPSSARAAGQNPSAPSRALDRPPKRRRREPELGARHPPRSLWITEFWGTRGVIGPRRRAKAQMRSAA